MKILNYKIVKNEHPKKSKINEVVTSSKGKFRSESMSELNLNVKSSMIIIKKVKFPKPNVSFMPTLSIWFLQNKIVNEISFNLMPIKKSTAINNSSKNFDTFQYNESKTPKQFTKSSSVAYRTNSNHNECDTKNYISTLYLNANKSNSVSLLTKNNNIQTLIMSKSASKDLKDKKYSYIILPGNNAELIRKCMAKRLNWKEASSKYSSIYNLKWGQSHYSMDYNLLSDKIPVIKVVNHFEFELEISNKKQMFYNILEYCDRNKLNPFNIIPLTIILKIERDEIDKNFNNFKLLFNNIEKHLDNSSSIKYTDYFPTTELEYNPVNTTINIPKIHYLKQNLWIIKPPDLLGGKNIEVSGNVEEIEKILIKYNKNSVAEEIKCQKNNIFEEKIKCSTMILQKYIERPFLYKGRKFDIRIWVLINYDLNVYMFKEGHLKISSIPYNLATNDRFVHITNYTLQKYNNNFERYEDGNELSFKDFQDYLDKECNSAFNIYRDIYPKFIEIIKISSLCVSQKINKKSRQYSFVIMGYDFMIDEESNVWLLEINKNPGFSESSPIVKMLLPRMIDNTFNLTIDKLYKNDIFNDQKGSKYYHVDNYNDEENLW